MIIRMRAFFSLLIAILLLSSICAFTCSKAGKTNFEVFKDNEKIGNLETNSELISGYTLYSLSSDVEIDMLIDVRISERISNKYEKGKLIAASHSRTVNGINQSSKDLRYEKDGYVSASGKPLTNTGNWIGASVLGLYYNEPIGLTAVYSEGQACWIKLVQQGSGTYKALLPDGKSTTFCYINGQLQKVVSETNWGQVVFKRR